MTDSTPLVERFTPTTYRYRYADPMSGRSVWRNDNNLWNGQRPTESEALYSATALTAAQAEIERLRLAMERAYGILWRDTGLRSVEMSIAARKELFTVITKDGQKRGIDHAASIFGHVTDEEALQAGEFDVRTATATRLQGEVDVLKEALESIARWAWRTDPPNATGKLTDAERFSAIKYHPTVQEFAKPHIELAEREALTKDSTNAG